MLFKGGRDSRTLACPLSTKQENTWKSHITVASKLRHLLDLFTISSIKEEQVHATVVVFEVYLAVHPNDSIHGFPQASAVCHMSYCNRTAMHYVGRVEGRVEDDKSSLCCATSSGFFSINNLFPHLRIFLQYKTGQNINTNFT